MSKSLFSRQCLNHYFRDCFALAYKTSGILEKRLFFELIIKSDKVSDEKTNFQRVNSLSSSHKQYLFRSQLFDHQTYEDFGL